MEQIQLAAYNEDRKKLLEEKLQTSGEKFQGPEILDAWTQNFSNLTELSHSIIDLKIFVVKFWEGQFNGRSIIAALNLERVNGEIKITGSEH